MWRLFISDKRALIELSPYRLIFFFFQAEDGIRDYKVTGVQTCALPILKFCMNWFNHQGGPTTVDPCLLLDQSSVHHRIVTHYEELSFGVFCEFLVSNCRDRKSVV